MMAEIIPQAQAQLQAAMTPQEAAATGSQDIEPSEGEPKHSAADDACGSETQHQSQDDMKEAVLPIPRKTWALPKAPPPSSSSDPENRQIAVATKKKTLLEIMEEEKALEHENKIAKQKALEDRLAEEEEAALARALQASMATPTGTNDTITSHNNDDDMDDDLKLALMLSMQEQQLEGKVPAKAAATVASAKSPPPVDGNSKMSINSSNSNSSNLTFDENFDAELNNQLLTAAKEFELKQGLCVSCKKLGFCPPVLRVCTRCQVTPYCSKECQKRDWKEGPHKFICDTFVGNPKEFCMPLHLVGVGSMTVKEMMECFDGRRKLFLDALKKAKVRMIHLIMGANSTLIESENAVFFVVEASFFANGHLQQVNHILVRVVDQSEKAVSRINQESGRLLAAAKTTVLKELVALCKEFQEHGISVASMTYGRGLMHWQKDDAQVKKAIQAATEQGKEQPCMNVTDIMNAKAAATVASAKSPPPVAAFASIPPVAAAAASVSAYASAAAASSRNDEAGLTEEEMKAIEKALQEADAAEQSPKEGTTTRQRSDHAPIRFSTRTRKGRRCILRQRR